MTAKRFGKKILKITGITLVILVMLLVGFHFWLKAHAKELIEELVASKSGGKLKLEIEKIHFNYFNRKIELEKAVFYNTDTLTGTTAYHFNVDKMLLQVKAIIPLILKKQFLIDSLTLLNPVVEVVRLKASVKPDKKIKKDVSIPEEIGKVYSSIQDALHVLKVKRFQIDEGTFRLINKIDTSQLPLTVSNIHFHIKNLQVDTGKLSGNEKLMFSENVVLRSRNQNITFPDGRHRISFSRFRINLQKKLVEFDSCTLAAAKGDSSANSFTIFFDKLLLSNIDFDALYKSELIKADSVYCVNPKFNLTVESGKKKGSQMSSPKLENIIKQLTGDLQVGFVVVSNADFNIKTIKEGVPNTYKFSNNNFEMQGLRIDQDAPKPLKVKNFAMAIRNYENFIKDSSYSIKFDSVLIKDDHITLSNFLFNKMEQGKILNTFLVPQFTLRGLFWDELVLDRKLRARQAIMSNPNITYSVRNKNKSKPGKQNIFQSLSSINEFMDLEQLDILNGKIDLVLKNNLRIKMDNATASIKSHSLLESRKLAGIKSSLTALTFGKGVIHTGKFDLELQNIRYAGQSGQFGGSKILLKNKEKNMLIDLQQVQVKKMLVDESSGNVYAEGVRWQKGNIKLTALGGNKDNNEASIELKDVKGTNTSFNGLVNSKSISTQLKSISFNELEKKAGTKLTINGLELSGQQLNVKDNMLHLSVGNFEIADNKNSSLHQIVYTANNGKMDAAISMPSLTVIPHIQPIINGVIALDAMAILKPVITIQLTVNNQDGERKETVLPKMDINELKLDQPKINFTSTSSAGSFQLNWYGEKNKLNFLEAKEIHTDAGNAQIDNLKIYLSDFDVTDRKGKTFNSGKGNVSAQLKNIMLNQPEKDHAEWSANIASLDASDFRVDSMGKSKGNNLVVNNVSLNNFTINSSNILSLQKLMAANPVFRIQNLTGYYSTAASTLNWNNASFKRSNNTLLMDSFSMMPFLSKEAFVAQQTYQTDYLTFKSGAVTIGPVDIDNYITKKILHIQTTIIENFLLTDYKDKQLPFKAGIIKPLPVNILKKIPVKLFIDTIQFNKAEVVYTEVGEKTKLAGTIPVNRLFVTLLNVKNDNLTNKDSLGIRAVGYLMDTVWVRLRVKESYTDSLSGFSMTLRMKPGDLTVLNSALLPTLSVKLLSGTLDTLSMRAVGREYLALGEMIMLYKNLKVQFLKNGKEAKKTLLTRLLTFAANTFIIKRNNLNRKGNVFYIRNRDKSAINYLIQIAISGMASSVGAKNNRRMIRRYSKELEQRRLPPIDFN